MLNVIGEFCKRRSRIIIAVTILSATAMGALLIGEGVCVVRYLPISFVDLFERWLSLSENVVFYFGLCCTIIGVVLLFKAVVGFLSVGDRVKRCCLLQFWLLTCVCVVVTVVVSVYLTVSMPRIRREVEHKWNASLTSYSSDKDSKEIIDFVQQLFECCGLRSRSDWKSPSFHNRSEQNRYPSSCCYDKTCKNSTAFSQGCLGKFDSFLFVRTVLYGITVPIFTIIEILCLIASTILIACPPNPGYQDIIEEDGCCDCCLCQRNSNENASKNDTTAAAATD